MNFWSWWENIASPSEHSSYLTDADQQSSERYGLADRLTLHIELILLGTQTRYKLLQELSSKLALNTLLKRALWCYMSPGSRVDSMTRPEYTRLEFRSFGAETCQFPSSFLAINGNRHLTICRAHAT
jgi:hypothetical protein